MPDELPASLPAPSSAATTGAPFVPPTADQATRHRSVGEALDPASDAGADAPRYADLLSVEVEDDGTTARIAVGFAGNVPAALVTGEIMGIGVDFYSGTARDSDYQVFADGSSDGWTIYFHTPSGLEDYPGFFRIEGPRLVFETAWSSLGDLRSGSFSAFADWSMSGVLPAASADRAPDTGSAPIAR